MRTEWMDLPAGLVDAVSARTGPVSEVAPIADGLTCRMAARLVTNSGVFFVKGVPVDDADGRAAQAWEVAVNPAVVAVSPVLRHVVVAGGWEVLVFDWVPGRHAVLSPGSSDLPVVASLLEVSQAVRAPVDLGVPLLAERLAPFLDAGERALLVGETLLHTDTNPHNLLVGGTRAHLVDWAMPAVGPVWVDAAYTAVRLMEDGASGDEALEWLSQFCAWSGADPKAVAAFVAGVCRQWEWMVGAVDCVPSNRRFEVLLGVGVGSVEAAAEVRRHVNDG